MQKSTITHILMLSASLSCLSPHAWAAHPLVTEDPNVQTQGKQQWELNTDARRSNLTAQSNQQISALTYTYGASDQLDVFFNLPGRLNQFAGVADASAGVKYLFAQNAQHSYGVKLEAFIPSGAERKGLSDNAYQLSTTLIHSYHQDQLTVHSNVYMNWHRFRDEQASSAQHTTVWRLSGAALYEFRPGWQAVLDLGLISPESRQEKRWQRYQTAGLIYACTPNLDIDAGLQWKQTQSNRSHQLGIGLAWRY